MELRMKNEELRVVVFVLVFVLGFTARIAVNHGDASDPTLAQPIQKRLPPLLILHS
jgi:hypothetical protein